MFRFTYPEEVERLLLLRQKAPWPLGIITLLVHDDPESTRRPEGRGDPRQPLCGQAAGSRARGRTVGRGSLVHTYTHTHTQWQTLTHTCAR